MDWNAIVKQPQGAAPSPQMADHAAECARFSWDAAREQLTGTQGEGLNMARVAVDRHASGPRASHVALRCLDRRGAVSDWTYAQLGAETSRFANVLEKLGVGRGGRVFLLLGRTPALYIGVLGALKHRCVATPLFSAFGPEPIQHRMTLGGAEVLVTTRDLYRRKVAAFRKDLPKLRHVILVGGLDGEETAGCLDWDVLLRAASSNYQIQQTDPEDMALLHFTSGTTGTPKGAIHVHDAVVAHHATARYALDLGEDDVFWCTADPGWVTGTSYGILAPLTHGVTSIVDEADFDAARWYRILQEQRVTVWYTAPTAVRMLMRAGEELPRGFDLSALRLVASVGEPLNPECVVWGQRALGRPIHDNWWQTETGGIMISNFLAMDIRPGSMGKPLPGIEAGIVHCDRERGRVEEVATGMEGELALRPGWPSMFRGYLDAPERYAKCFVGGWYLTGDLARRDIDGYFWFVGRADDVIKSSGHLIGPFEVESTLMAHAAVAEAGVIGKPDAVAGEIVKAFIVLRAGIEPSEALLREIQGFARARLGAAVAPREIAFVADLPRTRSGKILRRLLKARELGLPEGDTSTLEALP